MCVGWSGITEKKIKCVKKWIFGKDVRNYLLLTFRLLCLDFHWLRKTKEHLHFEPVQLCQPFWLVIQQWQRFRLPWWQIQTLLQNYRQKLKILKLFRPSSGNPLRQVFSAKSIDENFQAENIKDVDLSLSFCKYEFFEVIFKIALNCSNQYLRKIMIWCSLLYEYIYFK